MQVNKSSRPGLEGMFTVEDELSMIHFSKEYKSSFEPIYVEISLKLSIEKQADKAVIKSQIHWQEKFTGQKNWLNS